MSAPTVTQADIDAAQQELDDVIETAKSKGLYSPRTSGNWAHALGRVATLRRRFEHQQKFAKTSSGWGGTK